jgi:hypothetical protein
MLLYASPDSDRIAQKLTNAAPRAFGSFRMFEEPVNSQGLFEWNAAINEGLDLFSNANKKSKKAQSYVTLIANANNDLINSIKGMYTIVFGPAVNETEVSAENMHVRWNYKQQAVAVLERVQVDMTKIMTEIKASKVKLAEKDTLLELARYIHNYAETAVASIDFKFTTERKFKASIPQDRSWILRR